MSTYLPVPVLTVVAAILVSALVSVCLVRFNARVGEWGWAKRTGLASLFFVAAVAAESVALRETGKLGVTVLKGTDTTVTQDRILAAPTVDDPFLGKYINRQASATPAAGCWSVVLGQEGRPVSATIANAVQIAPGVRRDCAVREHCLYASRDVQIARSFSHPSTRVPLSADFMAQIL